MMSHSGLTKPKLEKYRNTPEFYTIIKMFSDAIETKTNLSAWKPIR